jgi:hypothetical protein
VLANTEYEKDDYIFESYEQVVNLEM